MKFQEALQLLQDGENVARLMWPQAEGYLTLLDDMKHVWKVIANPQVNAGNYIFSVADLVAEDWVHYREKAYNEDGSPKLPEAPAPQGSDAKVEL